MYILAGALYCYWYSWARA